MGQLKAQDVDWLEEAWLVSIALADLKEEPVTEWIGFPGLLNTGSPVGSSKRWKLKPVVKTRLELCLQTLTLHLFYRLCTAHKVKMPTNFEGTRWFHDITDPTELLITWFRLRPTFKGGQLLQEAFAFEAAYRLASILKDRYCNPVWKREVPLLVAGAGGKSASQHARHIGRASRGQRSNRLTDGLALCIARSPQAGWKAHLDDLTGDCVVTDWDDRFVYWRDDAGEIQETATGTFRNLRTKILKSI